ncbi:Tex-like protein [Eubacterium brachy ATCC 33089]|nr:Tex-like protein [Eubacterium brachy ATCC 33089]
MMDILKKLAEEFKIRESQVEATVGLIDEGNTIPFIARYRKEVTGALSDEVLRELGQRLEYLRNLQTRKEEVVRLIMEQEKLTPELEDEINAAETLQRVEDLYKPYKKKKATRASKAREKGLGDFGDAIINQLVTEESIEEFAEKFINSELGVETTDDAIAGAMDIAAEYVSDNADIITEIREFAASKGVVKVEGTNAEEKSVYEMYYQYEEAVSKIPNHRILAINRGEKEKFLKVKIALDSQQAEDIIVKSADVNEKSAFYTAFIEAIKDSYKRLIYPSVEREIRNMLTERAEEEAVKVFAKNTEKLLMAPGVKHARIISIDPGYRTGCKVAVLDETGKLLAYTTIYPTKPREDVKGTEKVLEKLCEKYDINIIVIGNGTASRETEEVVSNFIKKSGRNLKYTIVNEAGASVYSASKLASEEYPDLDVTTRGAMSLGRRLQDPLAELVKIPTKSIGVGQYQHDINQKNLENALEDVVERCVNRVGVDLNTASPSLLGYIAGINSSIAKNIVNFREEIGKFTDRNQLKKVPKLGPKAFNQCAGFMRIEEGKNPLDSTAVHPESYDITNRMLQVLGIDLKRLGELEAKDLDEAILREFAPAKKLKHTEIKSFKDLKNAVKNQNDTKELEKAVENMAKSLDVGEFTMKDIVGEIKKKGKDYVEDAPEVVFRADVTTFDDLKIGMEMTGTVRNVVDFGAFVDIGLKNDGLVHISQISDRFIKHPMDAVSVGDVVKVQIIDLDNEKQKIGLTMKIRKEKNR